MTYLYSCGDCLSEFEVKDLSVADKDLPLSKCCPLCGCRGKIVKLLYAVPFHLKGGGWYQDGYSDCLGNDPKFKRGEFSMMDLKD